MTTADLASTLPAKSPRSLALDADRGTVDNNIYAAVIAMAGHDLRQPLQIITNAHDILARTLCDTEQREELARAETAASRLAGMLSQLVDAVQLQEESSQCQHEPVALWPLFQQLALEFGYPAQTRGIELRVRPCSAVVQSHRVLLSGILRNLVRNAIDYTPHGGRVLVSCRTHGSEINIEIRDSGVGIAPGELAKIFDAFHRADSTRADGLGLGLFIVHHAAQFLGHRIKVRSALGRGSSFMIVAQRPVPDAASRRGRCRHASSLASLPAPQ